MQRKWQVTSIVVLGVFMASLDLFIVNIAFPDIGRDFSGASLSSLSWVLNAYAIVFAAFVAAAGSLLLVRGASAPLVTSEVRS